MIESPSFRELIEHAGFALCAIDRGSKSPRYARWNENPIPADAADGLDGAGILHVQSKTCCIDVDALELARPWLLQRGIDLDALLIDDRAVRIESGRPGRTKLLYRMDPSLRTVKPKGSGLEFRCATANGKSVQDVAPPSKHPETKRPYRWRLGILGDWYSPPRIPAPLLALWRSIVAEDTCAVETKPQMSDSSKASSGAAFSVAPSIGLDELAQLLNNLDPDSDHDEWLNVGMALHHETGGSGAGLQLWDTWSAEATRIGSDGKGVYRGLEHLATRWRSFSSSAGKRSITVAYLRARSVAAADEFEIITEACVSTIQSVPKAQHLCTDQANAERLQKRYGDRLISVAGTFFVFDGNRWRADDGLPQRFACELSNILNAEVENKRARVSDVRGAIPEVELQAYMDHPRLRSLDQTEKGREFLRATQDLEALEKWSRKCEMKATQDAALGLLKKLLAVDADRLDSDPWLLNCENGTVDLRTGRLREHCASDLITKLAPVCFDREAAAPRFVKFLSQIFADDRPLIDFMQRWCGYCATGDAREQCMAILWGAGSNGKSTFIGALTSVLGGYATTAPTGLLTAKNSDSRHPAEIAKLHGARIVTASESEDGAKFREAFVKELTGGDRLAARRMYGEWFDFRPTHKLQMLTNHKPQIRGSDHGIWRRLLLVPFTVTFGIAEEVAAGRAVCLKDQELNEALAKESAGILNWIVAGTMQWKTEGLQPPAAVLEAGRAYREEQDRIGEFIRERCRVDRDARETPSTLYAAYRDFCHEAGIDYPLTRQRFLDEIEQRVPGLVRAKSHGARYVKGIALVLTDLDLLA